MVSDRWLGLEIRHLSALRAISEQGTFASAASRLGYTQSAISQQVAALERITGTSLLERANGSKPLGLTDAGNLVLRHGEAIIARVQAMRADVTALAAGAAGPLRVGTYPSVGARLLPNLLPSFAADWPQLELHLHESNSDTELLGLIEQGELDLAFCMLPLGEGPFDGIELLRDPWLLVLPASVAPGKDTRSAPQPSATQRLLCFRSCPNITEIESLLHGWGIEPTIVFRSDDNATLQSLVAAGVGAAFMPWLTVDPSDPGTQLVDMSDKLPARRIAIAWHRDRHRPPASHAFVEAAAKISVTLEATLAKARPATTHEFKTGRPARPARARPADRGYTAPPRSRAGERRSGVS